MRYKVIWIMAGMIALWMLCMGISLVVDFDRVQQSNQATAELEWTFICDAATGDYADISVIEGGKNFIGESYNDVDHVVIDEKGRALSDTYDLLEPLGNGYVRFEYTPPGVAIMEDGKNKRTMIGVLDDEGKELPEDEALQVLKDSADGEAQVKKSNTGETAFDDAGGSASETQNGDAGYHVAKGDRKYVGIKDRAGRWVVPPAFDKIEITPNQNYAVIRNGSNIGVAVLGK